MKPTIIRRRHTVTIYQGDDLEELYDHAQSALVAASSRPLRAGDTPTVAEEAAAYNERLAKADAERIDVVLQALSNRGFRSLKDEYPPREDDEQDLAMGVNKEALGDPLIAACWVSPEMDDDEVVEFIGDLSDGDYQRLYQAAWWLNTRSGEAPKALSLPSDETGRVSDI